ncbi:type IV secretory system conjugative DNA transfer family protein [Pacificibacter sp. AS14]|uniref:type IV secretory system conjugative DNA transfer family protein n=1 Tax=Pacificibacter sp. AS14 TaxID=3135785 RepID=UPI003181D2A0
MVDLQRSPHGSAGFANALMRKSAGLMKRHGAYIGTDEAGRHHYSSQQSAILVCGGARSLKGSVLIPWLIDGCLNGAFGPMNIVSLDFKFQNGRIAALQARQGRHVVNITPRETTSSSIDVLSYIDPKSPELIPLAKLFAANWIPFSGGGNAAFFEGSAQRLLEGVIVVLARKNNGVTLPELADVMAGFGDATDDWLDFEYDLSIAPEAEYRKIAQELTRLRDQGSDSGGYSGIKNEIARSFSVMSDPQWRKVLSPPFDFCPSQLTKPDAAPYFVTIAENKDYSETAAPVLRAIFTAFLVYKRRVPAAASREQFWLLDEIGNVGKWPMAVELATYGPGYGIRPAYIVQSTAQLDNLAPRASTILPNSCGTQIYTGTRSVEQAALINRQLGRVTLDYVDPQNLERAQVAKAKALARYGAGQADAAVVAAELAEQEHMARQYRPMARDLRNVDEIINEANGKAFVFLPGVLEKPAYLTIRPYWERRDLAGAAMPDPFHAKDLSQINVPTRFGMRRRPIVTERVRPEYAHLYQYQSGYWSYVKGYRP